MLSLPQQNGPYPRVLHRVERDRSRDRLSSRRPHRRLHHPVRRCTWLGEIGLVAVVDDQADGDALWRLAQQLGGRGHGQDQARWILTQASRARMVASFTDLVEAKWTAYIRRRFALDALFANHEILMTGRMDLPVTPAPL